MVRVIAESALQDIVARTRATLARDEWPRRRIYRTHDGRGIVVMPGPRSGTVKVTIIASCNC